MFQAQVKWKIQLVEVSLFENEQYAYAHLYSDRARVLKESIQEVPGTAAGERVFFDLFRDFTARTDQVYRLADDLTLETNCVETIKVWSALSGYDQRRCTICKSGQDSIDIPQNLRDARALSENQASFIMFHDNILQFRTIAPVRIPIMNADNPPRHLQLCGICEENPRDVIFAPCSHCYACYKFSAHLKLCPRCRVRIDKQHSTSVLFFATHGIPFTQTARLQTPNVLSLLTDLKALSRNTTYTLSRSTAQLESGQQVPHVCV